MGIGVQHLLTNMCVLRVYICISIFAICGCAYVCAPGALERSRGSILFVVSMRTFAIGHAAHHAGVIVCHSPRVRSRILDSFRIE